MSTSVKFVHVRNNMKWGNLETQKNVHPKGTFYLHLMCWI